MTTINNLTKHDSREFKVGDLVVSKDKNDQTLYEIKKIHHNKIDGWFYLYLKNTMYKNSGERGDYADKYEHATLEEIKAGHRIDERTDHVTDIRNHVSPSTVVKDLEAERHG